MTSKPVPLPRLKALNKPFVSRMSTSEEVRSRRKEYTKKCDFKFFIATWNVGSVDPQEVSLREWLKTVEDTPDFYVIGLQEVDMDAETILWGETKVIQSWVDRISEAINDTGDYEELQSVRFVGMQLTVMIKKMLKGAISECMTAMVARGALNVYGNKGGIGISFCFNENLFCFVNSHFAAHQHEYEKRNEDFQEITNKMVFLEEGCKTRRILSHDHIFWLGDLNYRVEVKEFPDDKYRYKDFTSQDQLAIARRDGKAFVDYQEGQIRFKPTYKFKDKVNYDKARVPSWCDRILWKSDKVFQTLYDSIPSVCYSDHKPVFAYFLVSLDTADQELLKKVVGEVLRSNDKRENDLVPMLKVHPKDINFGVVKINDTVAATLELVNTGFIPVVFQLKNKSNETKDSLPTWLTVSHLTNCIPPGQRFLLTFTAKVDHLLADILMKKYKNNFAIRKIPVDIVIMHVVQGSDIFLTIYFELLPSCFGATFEQMCKTPKPLGKVRINEMQDIEEEQVTLRRNLIISGITPEIPNINRKIPMEIFRLVDFLYRQQRDTRKLFLVNKTEKTSEFDDIGINIVRDYLDNWGVGSFPGSVKAAFGTLLKILEMSPTPLLPISDRDITTVITANRYDLAQELIMQKVCPLNRRIFLYLCLFVQEMRNGLPNDKSTDLNIALIFARVMIRDENQTGALVTANALTYNLSFLERKRKFLLQFFTTPTPMCWVQKELFKP
ncbi:inositol polyphosphate 5-phosphatase OCRL-like [Culicoides brevitarsis]|uniref:inositol polyphosphate 5-phosphatase OCRL-like n=1 Tax=Culicoides brevitarsis TaxID=469753 RepID=UPI00307C088A